MGKARNLLTSALAGFWYSYDIGLNIDAEEMDRLELSLDLLESLATDAEPRKCSRCIFRSA